MKVLIVESDKILAENLRRVLKLSGHKTDWQVNLQSAIEAVDNFKPNVIVLDLVLAGRSGIEFLHELRSYADWQKMPVIIWSDFSNNEVESLLGGLKDLGIHSYNHKSGLKLQDLVSRLNFQSV